MTATKSLTEQRNDLMVEIRNIAEKAEKENGGEFAPDDAARVKDLMAKAAGLQTEITAQKVSKALAADVQEFLGKADAEALNADALENATPGFKGRRVKSLGEYFTGSKEFKAAMARGGVAEFNGTKSLSAGHAFSLEAPVAVPGGLKALVGTDPAGNGSGVGTLYDPQRIPTVEATWPELNLRNVVTVGQTNSDAITYARILRAGAGSENNAAGVPEATTAAAVGSGDPAVTPTQAGVKPESALRFEKVSTPVVTIAHWIPATKKALSDAGQLRTLIDNFLRRGLEQELERQILSGDSSDGEEFDGLVNTDGIQVQSFDTNIVKTIRKALTKVSKYGRANAVLVSPGTAERIDMLQMSTGQFFGGGPFGPANPTIWRKPIVEVPGLADSTVLVGDFSTAVVWDREEATITATDSHLDFFTRNLVAILAESRAAFGVLDPALICKVTVTGTDDMTP